MFAGNGNLTTIACLIVVEGWYEPIKGHIVWD